MKRISAFISYSSTQKQIGGRLKNCLNTYCGFEIFIAHDDIDGGMLWEEEIYRAIQECDLFIPLISKAFKQSDFADQEIGIAVSLQKKIIPIKLELMNPYGFINKYQALNYKIIQPTYQNPKIDNTSEISLAIGQICLATNGSKLFHEKALNCLIEAFCKSNSYNTTNSIIQLLIKCKDLSSSHLTLIHQAIKENHQVTDAYGLNDLKLFLQNTYNFQVD